MHRIGILDARLAFDVIVLVRALLFEGKDRPAIVAADTRHNGTFDHFFPHGRVAILGINDVVLVDCGGKHTAKRGEFLFKSAKVLRF